ncbi:MAG: hypothetical protein CM1200mP27_08160 [Chloroflexota bacterium]|nr:MAG: hypothetical protein CM1200mP27_08160 [Chloroflexota bacterium]
MDQEPAASGADGLRSVQITEAMIESVRTRRTVTVGNSALMTPLPDPSTTLTFVFLGLVQLLYLFESLVIAHYAYEDDAKETAYTEVDYC